MAKRSELCAIGRGGKGDSDSGEISCLVIASPGSVIDGLLHDEVAVFRISSRLLDLSAEPTTSSQDFCQPDLVLWSQGSEPIPSSLDDGVRDDLFDSRTIRRLHVHTVGDQVGKSGGKWREVDDGEIIRAECLPWRSAVWDANVGSDFEDDQAETVKYQHTLLYPKRDKTCLKISAAMTKIPLSISGGM
jgi:hypothetical protein